MSTYSNHSADSTASDKDVRDRTEDFNKYMPGGYHPIQLDDELNDRYRIIHRLGNGGYSTVWLAVDETFDETLRPNRFRPRYVEIKVCTADSKSNEAAVLHRLRAGRFPWLPSWLSFLAGRDLERIVAVIDTFDVTGPNGTHCCIVTEFLGPSVQPILAHPNRSMGGRHELPLDIARRVAIHAAEAVTVLHNRQIVHGDLHTGNLAFVPTVDINSWTVEELYAALGEPEKITIEDADFRGIHDDSPLCGNLEAYDDSHRPPYLVGLPSIRSVWAPCNTSASNIRVIDFSEALFLPFYRDPEHHFGVLSEFRAPELVVNFREDVSSSVDIWALGCSILTALGLAPFSMFMAPSILPQITELTGGKENMPEKYWKAFREQLSKRDLETLETLKPCPIGEP